MFHAANFISQALGGVLAGPSRSASMMPDEKYPALYDTRRWGEGEDSILTHQQWGQRDSNSQPSDLESDALPLRHTPDEVEFDLQEKTDAM